MIVKKIAVFCTGNIKAYNAFGTEQYEVFIKINEFKKYEVIFLIADKFKEIFDER